MTHELTVATRQGTVEGAVTDGVYRWLGLPFAAPPVGDLRWRAPQPPQSWDGVRDATAFAPAAIQTFRTPADLRAPESEDCLYLNVWTTNPHPGAKQPVMLWIHGGGNLWGAGSLDHFDGSDLAREGVTVVTINYRLGALGFLAHREVGANFAVLDWVAALTWVSQNIAAFGGDPGNVTIFGQSAGAVAVRTLLSTPAAHGLFHRAIIQSAGFEHYAFAPTPSYERVSAATEKLFDRIGTRNIDELRAAPIEDVRAASLEFSGIFPPAGQVHTPANLVWYPVDDGETVIQSDFQGWPEGVPVMFGCVANEARYFIKPTGEYSWETVENMARALGGENGDAILADLAARGVTPYDALDEIFSAAIWFEPALATAERFTAAGRDFRYYHFSRVSPGARKSNALVEHAAENNYVFGVLLPAEDYDEKDEKVSAEIQHAWSEFARTGVPRSRDGKEWPLFDPADPLHARIDDETQIRSYEVGRVTALIHSVRVAPVR
jgi:para-nitrobenzyl esterase